MATVSQTYFSESQESDLCDESVLRAIKHVVNYTEFYGIDEIKCDPVNSGLLMEMSNNISIVNNSNVRQIDNVQTVQVDNIVPTQVDNIVATQVDNIVAAQVDNVVPAQIIINNNNNNNNNKNKNNIIQVNNTPLPALTYENGGMPTTEEFSGDYNFQVLSNSNSRGSVFSIILKKFYIDMNCCLPLRFKWEPLYAGFSLRVTMVYSEENQRNEAVRRCLTHKAFMHNKNVPDGVLDYVVRCDDPNTQYKVLNGHYTLLIPLGSPQPGVTYVPLNFKFYCKNSCASGMNRRGTELIFNLETDSQEVVGRKCFGIRVCSCPKRDIAKEELDLQKKIPSGGFQSNRSADENLNINVNIHSDNIGGFNFPFKGKRRIAPSSIVTASNKKVMVMQPPLNESNTQVPVYIHIPGRELAIYALRQTYYKVAGDANLNNDYESKMQILNYLKWQMNNI